MNLFKRVLVAIVFIPLLLWLLYNGGIKLLVFLGLLTVLVSYEIINMFKKKGINLLFFTVVPSLLFFYFISEGSSHSIQVLFFVLILNGIREVFQNKIEGATQRVAGTLLTVIYPALGFGILYKLSFLHYSIPLVLAVLIWMTDISAYFVGMSLGKHRDIFKCSPKKSLEGFIAGIVFAFIGAWMIKFIFPDFYTLKHQILFGISAGFFGQYGDLFASLIKRDMGVKDSSNLIPGHGGVLDRFDSILTAAPALYLLLKLI